MMHATAEPLSDAFPESYRATLESRLLPAWLPRQRWWRAKSRTLASVAIEAAVPVTAATHIATFCIVRAEFDRGEHERYAVPLTRVRADRIPEFPEAALVGTAPDGLAIVDACHDSDFRAALLDLLAGKTEAAGYGGFLRGLPESRDAFADTESSATEATRLFSGEQSNTSFSFDERIGVKIYRRVEAETNPEPEMLRFLRRAGHRGAPTFLSSLEWVPGNGGPAVTLALAQEFVREAKDAWTFVIEELKAAPAEGALPGSLARLAATLGTCLGELHAALASRPGDPDFAPAPLTEADLAAARAGSLARIGNFADLIGEKTAERLREKLRGAIPVGEKIRVHGDLHLGQILLAEDGPRLLDFEGEPGRPLAEARRKASPLRDAAGMLRSFHYAAHVAARDAFAEGLGSAFREGYFAAAEAAGLFSKGAVGNPEILDLLNLFVLEKALYELEYEHDNRPDWVGIPLRGLRALAS